MLKRTSLYSLVVVLMMPAISPAQTSIPASRASIASGEFRFRIVTVAFEETAMGFAPSDMGPGDRVMLVEFKLLEGSRDSFKNLEVQATYAPDGKSSAVILIADGMVRMLSAVIMTGKSSDFRPAEDNVAWAFVVPGESVGFFLEFPTGETIDLSPLIK